MERQARAPEPEATRRFLDAYEGVQGLLRRLVGADRFYPFGELVTRAAQQSRPVRAYVTDLKEYGDLRNALVHERGDGHALAEPYEETVQRIEDIRRLLERPPFALDVVHVARVATCTPSQLVGEVAGMMLAGSFSQLPVYEDGRLTALLTAETIARWLGANLRTGIGLVEEEPVAALLRFTEDPDNFQLVPRTTTVFDVLALFDDYAHRGKYLDAILISQNGKATEALLSILTTFDIPRIVEASRA